MGETVVVDQNDIRALEENINYACSAYVASYNDLEVVMHTFQNGSGSIAGPLANELSSKFNQKEQIFAAIRSELVKAQEYMGEKGKQLANTMNSISAGMR